MCTLIMAIGVFDQPGLFVIANRDEALNRPAREPTVHERGAMNILAPQDAKAGGTWLGLNERGLFAGITNRFRMASKPHHISRGQLVFDALEHPTATEAARSMSGLSAPDYNGFHLVMADGSQAFVVWNDGQKIDCMELEPGYHVISERSFGAADSLRLVRMRRRLENLGPWSDDYRQLLRQWMVEHDEQEPLESTCIHLDGHNYGTRSSTIVEVGKVWRFLHASGPPCSTDYDRYDQAVEQFRGSRLC